MMAAEFVVYGAFLSSVFKEIHGRLAGLRDFRNVFDEEVVKRLEIVLSDINGLLDDAEFKQHRDPKVKNWLDDLQHEVYELEQLLDMIDSDTNAQRKGTIRLFVSGFIKRFEYRTMIKELLHRLEFLAGQRYKLGLHKAIFGNHDTPVSSPTSLENFDFDLHGRKREKEELIDFLLADSDSTDNQASIISVVGVGGIGKTFFVNNVYSDIRIEDQFEMEVWITVSRSPNLDHLARSILRYFSGSSAAESKDLEILQHELQQRLTGNRYLLVLDDVVWSKDRNMLEHLLLPLSRGSSEGKVIKGKVIITTRDKEVASILGSTRMLHLKQLEESNSWSLFVQSAFHGRNVFEYPNLESIGKKIVEKCGGLPLALRTIGDILRIKFNEREWVNILEDDFYSDDYAVYIYPLLKLSYLSLPSNVKRCLAYCSMFPKDYEFDKGQLIKLWMAEGLLKCLGRHNSEEELGNEFFNHLRLRLFHGLKKGSWDS